MYYVAAHVFAGPVERTAVSDAAGLGAAMCAAVAHGTYSDFSAAVAAMVRPGIEVVPDEAATKRYAEVLQGYAEIAPFTDPLFMRLEALPR